jgi:hypothetical protein
MSISPSIHQFRRAVVETWIERLIMLLDELDGDENIEDNGDLEHDTSDIEPNGDEADFNGYAEEFCPSNGYDGSGERIAEALLRNMRSAAS